MYNSLKLESYRTLMHYKNEFIFQRVFWLSGQKAQLKAHEQEFQTFKYFFINKVTEQDGIIWSREPASISTFWYCIGEGWMKVELESRNLESLQRVDWVDPGRKPLLDIPQWLGSHLHDPQCRTRFESGHQEELHGNFLAQFDRLIALDDRSHCRTRGRSLHTHKRKAFPVIKWSKKRLMNPWRAGYMLTLIICFAWIPKSSQINGLRVCTRPSC